MSLKYSKTVHTTILKSIGSKLTDSTRNNWGARFIRPQNHRWININKSNRLLSLCRLPSQTMSLYYQSEIFIATKKHSVYGTLRNYAHISVPLFSKTYKIRPTNATIALAARRNCIDRIVAYWEISILIKNFWCISHWLANSTRTINSLKRRDLKKALSKSIKLGWFSISIKLILSQAK